MNASAAAATACALVSVAACSPSLGALGGRRAATARSLPLRCLASSVRVATQLPVLGSAAPQLRAPRAPRRHALALEAKLQRLARAERRAAASGPRASQATRRQPVSCFRSTQVRTVRQNRLIAKLASFERSSPPSVLPGGLVSYGRRKFLTGLYRSVEPRHAPISVAPENHYVADRAF